MGIKGDQLSNQATLTVELLMEKLQATKDLKNKKMFGGYGLFYGEKMFGMVDSKGVFFLKADESNRAVLIQKGGLPHSKMPYYSVLDSSINNQKLLLELVNNSLALLS